jgi:hypothetical protein
VWKTDVGREEGDKRMSNMSDEMNENKSESWKSPKIESIEIQNDEQARIDPIGISSNTFEIQLEMKESISCLIKQIQ